MTITTHRRQFLSIFGRWLAAIGLFAILPPKKAAPQSVRQILGASMKLPKPNTKGQLTVEQAIQQRRTVRAYSQQLISLEGLSQLLWSAQGITGRRGLKRAAPSAGALYPMDLYAVVGHRAVNQLEAGVYHYDPQEHGLTMVNKQDLRKVVARACLSQMWMASAPIHLVITAEYQRITGKYGQRGIRYAFIEAGHIGQNLFLQAEALGLKAGIVGAYHDEKLIEIMAIPRTHEPLLVMPIGYAA